MAVFYRAHSNLPCSEQLARRVAGFNTSLHCLSFSAELRVVGRLELICLTSYLTQRLMSLSSFVQIGKDKALCLVIVPRVETRRAALGTLKVGSEVGEASAPSVTEPQHSRWDQPHLWQ